MADGSTGAASMPPIPLEMPPLIRCEVGKPHEWIAKSIASLRADPDIYRRDSELVHVTRITHEEAEESRWTGADGKVRHALTAGTPTIHTMTLPALRVRMARWATWTRPVKKNGTFEDQPCEPTKAMAEELRDEGHWPGLRPLDGVSETPFPRPDITIVQGDAHYDRATRYLYEPSGIFDLVPDAPTLADARAAREDLEDLFVDFPFASPAGRSGVLAALLTLLCRPAIMGPCPAWIVGATTPGTGKSMLADTVAAIALGRDAGRMHFPTPGRNGDEELSKRLGMCARMALPLVCFDNADDATIGGDVMEEVISVPGKYTFRLLGVTAGLTLPVRMIFIFTGNNPQWSRGMNRRVLHISLESPYADPEKRPIESYVYPERAGRLPAYALENRARYVKAALTIVRAYAHAGCPNPLTLGTFEAWARLIPSALVWAGGEDPMACRPGENGDESPDTLARQSLARQWDAFCRATDAHDGTTAHAMIDRLYPKLERGQPADPAWDELRGAIEFFAPQRQGQPPDPGHLASALSRRLKGAAIRVADAPAPLRRFVSEGKTGGRARWKVEDVPAPMSGAERRQAALVARLRAEEERGA